jgi:hypothetical protein
MKNQTENKARIFQCIYGCGVTGEKDLFSLEIKFANPRIKNYYDDIDIKCTPNLCDECFFELQNYYKCDRSQLGYLFLIKDWDNKLMEVAKTSCESHILDTLNLYRDQRIKQAFNKSMEMLKNDAPLSEYSDLSKGYYDFMYKKMGREELMFSNRKSKPLQGVK